jgi:hypothetical protein
VRGSGSHSSPSSLHSLHSLYLAHPPCLLPLRAVMPHLALLSAPLAVQGQVYEAVVADSEGLALPDPSHTLVQGSRAQALRDSRPRVR